MPKRAVTPPCNRKHNPSEAAGAAGGQGRSCEVEHGSPRSSSPFPNVGSLRRTRFSSVPLVQIKHPETEEITFPASVELPRRHVTFYSDVDSDSSLSGGGLCSMSDTMESFKDLGGSPSAHPGARIKHLTRNSDGSSRFPKLDECAHFHYDNVELGPINVALSEGDREGSKGGCVGVDWWFCVQVTSNGKTWEIRRSLDNFQMLDRQLHRCVYDRKFSQLKEVSLQHPQPSEDSLKAMLTEYLERFSQLAGSLINCGPVLNWLELDNRGNRLIVTDEAAINTPAVAAAYVIKRYASQASDEISLEVGDILSVIDMPPPEESTWWRGKKGFQVGFFPCECVEIIGDKVPQSIKIPKVSAKPVLRKHGKLIAFFRSFLVTRPSRRKLKQSGILKERVFGCDLGEHLMNTGRDIPLVLKCCTEFIEQYGIVDGIYRLSGVTSNIQKLRLAFDEDRVPNLMDEAILQDIHCVASLLKMYFRELPNPLLTFHLYDKFVNAVQADEDLRLLKLRDVVQQLPPPHYRSLEYLMRHLSKVAAHGFQTGMTPKNVAIVWAPNLLRSRDIENGGVGALHVVGVQAVLTEYLIRYTDIIFSEKMPVFPSPTPGEETPKKTRPKSLAISTPTKLLSLEEARSRALTANLPGDQQKFIDVGGGEDNLPIKYHTVIELPSRRRSVGKGKKSPSGWRSFFARGWQTASGRRKSRRPRSEGGTERPKIGSPIFSEHSPLALQDKAVTESDVSHTNTKKLRTVKSAEALFPQGVSFCHQIMEPAFSPVDEGTGSEKNSFEQSTSSDGPASSASPSKSPGYQKHVRSTSHDSYFERIIEVPSDDESETGEPLSEGLHMKSMQQNEPELAPGPDTNRLSVSREKCDLLPERDSPLRHKKVAQKQKLHSFDSEASSPKLQKLSLKRLYNNLSSPPTVKKKETSVPMDEELSLDGILEARTSGVHPLLSDQGSCENAIFSESDKVYVEVHEGDDSRAIYTLDDSENVMNFSMEATLSESVSLSQLLSFDGDDVQCEDAERPPKGPESLLTTPESPTADNISEIPSSACSEASGDADKQRADGFLAELSSKSGEHDSSSADQLADRTRQLQLEARPCEVTNGFGGEDYAQSDGSFDENIILSPPANFVDDHKIPKGLERSMTEGHDMYPRLASGMAFSGSMSHELFRMNHDSAETPLGAKKRSGSDKASPISPVEESRRRFESEIGRLIVRDRQMKLEMEQIKAERQKQKVTITESKLKPDKKFVDVVEFRKSPVKTFDPEKRKLDSEDLVRNFRDPQEEKKTPEPASNHGYPRYIMENKPSVKELLSKFETPKKSEEGTCEAPPKFTESAIFSPKRASSMFSNVQVVNHNLPSTSCRSLPLEYSDTRQRHDNREHIFQTECVIRFPHPKPLFRDSNGVCDTSPRTLDHRSRLNSSRVAFLSPEASSCRPRGRPADVEARPFSAAYTRAHRVTTQMRAEFLQGMPDESRRQRPKSVPPPVCRMTYTAAKQQAEAEDVPKRAGACNGDRVEASQERGRSPPRRIRERAAMFERSLSFSGYVDRRPFTVAGHSRRAQADFTEQ